MYATVTGEMSSNSLNRAASSGAGECWMKKPSRTVLFRTIFLKRLAGLNCLVQLHRWGMLVGAKFYPWQILVAGCDECHGQSQSVSLRSQAEEFCGRSTSDEVLWWTTPRRCLFPVQFSGQKGGFPPASNEKNLRYQNTKTVTIITVFW